VFSLFLVFSWYSAYRPVSLPWKFANVRATFNDTVKSYLKKKKFHPHIKIYEAKKQGTTNYILLKSPQKGDNKKHRAKKHGTTKYIWPKSREQKIQYIWLKSPQKGDNKYIGSQRPQKGDNKIHWAKKRTKRGQQNT
jgi:hypothetical protein